MRVAALDHLDVLVERLVLVQEPRVRLDGSGRHGEQRCDSHGDEQPAPAEEEAAGQRDDRSADEERALGADQRDQDERREKGAQQAPDRRQGVETPRDGAGVGDVRDRQPDRERRDHAEEGHGWREEQEDGEEGADHRSRRQLVEALDGNVQQGSGDEVTTAIRTAAASTIGPSNLGSGRRSASLPPSQ